MEVKEVNCLICSGECGPSLHVIGVPRESRIHEFLGPLCELYNLSEEDCQNSVDSDFGCCQLCLEDLTRVKGILKDLRILQGQLENVKKELDKRIQGRTRKDLIFQNEFARSLRRKLIGQITGNETLNEEDSLDSKYEIPQNHLSDEEFSDEYTESIPPNNELFNLPFPIMVDAIGKEDVKPSEEIKSSQNPKALQIRDLRSECLTNKPAIILKKLTPKEIKRLIKSQLSNESKRFKCPMDGCGKEYLKSRYLRFHIEVKHKSNPKPNQTFPCPHCSRLCPNRFSLSTHIRAYHAKELPHPYKCTFPNCNLGFKHKLYFERHLKIHEPGYIRPSKPESICDQCGKSYKKQGQLNKHIRKVHLNIRPHICPTCGKGYNSPGKLRDHEKTHLDPEERKALTEESKAPCHICGQILTGLESMKNHIRYKHKKIKPYICEVRGCGKTFINNCSRMEHYAIHINPKRAEYDPEFAEKAPQSLHEFLERRKMARDKYSQKKKAT